MKRFFPRLSAISQKPKVTWRQATSDKRQPLLGFTLIELLIVIAVIGILATVLIIALNPAQQLRKSRDAGRKTALKNIQESLEAYYTDNGSYPNVALCRSDQTSTCWTVSNSVPANNLLGIYASSYIKAMPADPSQTGTTCLNANFRNYAYQVTGGGTGYLLSTRLENTTDSQIIAGGVGTCTQHNYQLVNQQ